MNLSRYGLGDKPLKLLRDATLLKTDKCLVKIEKDTLALPVLVDERVAGYVFHGSGQFVMDTIIETKKGAIGKPITQDLTQPFIMLGKAETMGNNVSAANTSDLEHLGYSSTEAFVKTADNYCSRFLRGKIHCGDLDTLSSHVFAFPNGDQFDLLVSKEDKLAYTSREKVFVFKEGKEVLTSPEHIVVSKRGKAIIIENGNVMIEK